MAQKEIKIRPTPKKDFVIIGIIVAFFVFLGFASGLFTFAYAVVRCGAVPVKITHTSFWGGDVWYDTPGNYTPLDVTARYVCTEQNAIDEDISRGLSSGGPQFR